MRPDAAVRVQVREPVEALARALEASLVAQGMVVVGDEDGADVVVWAVGPSGGLAALRLASRRARILALVDEPRRADVAELMAAGAHGVVIRGDASAAAGAALAVARGYCVQPQGLLTVPGRTESLSEQELAWMRALARGEQVQGLARTTGYSEREMYRKLRNTYRKLRAPSRTEALLTLARANLLDAG